MAEQTIDEIFGRLPRVARVSDTKRGDLVEGRREADEVEVLATAKKVKQEHPEFFDIEHLDGHMVHVSREKITWPGARIRKKGEGMPNYDNNNLFGTMYITFDVEFPKGELLEKDKQAISKIIDQDPVNSVYNGLGGFKSGS